ncbi:TIGR04076 family protein [Gemmobacter megaterium]|uniref:TIGR04076 family protein n=1 Tax=Gemmobacter megaterium TaxID=1086013 RepID=A0A1N7NAP5_9RHOB|nr:TIGR04076 family protein [Gemmobacter megaterium]GGE13975.1 TIGR04076 family protein [Gemmobacter megaterium]SIS95386.1 TIGR04076 family protein [Gemmobacter megaterium]
MERNGEKGFWLYDLRVETVVGDRHAVCRHVEGEVFRVIGENLVFDGPAKVPMYALVGILPHLPARQRETDPDDWMSTDAEIACADPHCGGRFRIVREGRRWFSHAETTGLPEARSTPYWKDEQ